MDRHLPSKENHVGSSPTWGVIASLIKVEKKKFKVIHRLSTMFMNCKSYNDKGLAPNSII